MIDSSPTNAMLTVHELHLWRGEHHLLRGVSFYLRPGELLQVHGANGAGKTSLLRCVAGLMPAESGDVLWQDRAIDVGSTFHESLLYLGHSSALKIDLTAWENLKYSVGLQLPVTRLAVEQALARLKIPQCMDLPVRVLSAGQRRRVALARLLLLKLPLWILDEPITNLDVDGIVVVEQIMTEHLAHGGMILVAAHQTLLSGHAALRSLLLH